MVKEHLLQYSDWDGQARCFGRNFAVPNSAAGCDGNYGVRSQVNRLPGELVTAQQINGGQMVPVQSAGLWFLPTWPSAEQFEQEVE